MDVTRLLLVDDNAAFLRILQRFLQQQNDLNIVGVARGGEEGLFKAQYLKPDSILLDLAMKDIPGLQLLPRLRADLPHARIIVLSLLDSNVYRTAALALGADNFVSKAAMDTELISAIRGLGAPPLPDATAQSTASFRTTKDSL